MCWPMLGRTSYLQINDIELKKLSYQQICNILKGNPVFVARYFQYKVKVFFKEIMIDSALG